VHIWNGNKGSGSLTAVISHVFLHNGFLCLAFWMVLEKIQRGAGGFGSTHERFLSLGSY
jgi:hypothetical protein